MTLYQPNQPQGPYNQQRPDYQPQWPPQQQQFYQQPGNQPTPMMPPQFQPPTQPPTKKRRKWPIILLVLAVIVAIIVLAASLSSKGSDTTTNTTKTTTSATQAATAHTSTWKTTHTFTGNGSKKTETFSVPDDWKMNWSCDPTSFQNIAYNVIITVYNTDGTIADSGVNATCKAGSTSGSTEIHTSGNLYLDIISEGDWNIQIQELK